MFKLLGVIAMKKIFWLLVATFTFMGTPLLSSVFGAVDHVPQEEVRGYVYLARVFGQHFEPLYPRALTNLGEAIKKYTNIKVQILQNLWLSDRGIHDFPVLYLITRDYFELYPAEIENLKKYVAEGGFIIADNGDPYCEFAPAEMSFHKMFEDILGSAARPEPLAISHELYRIYFPFDDGPPLGSENIPPPTPRPSIRCGGDGCTVAVTYEPKPVDYLEGYYLDGRLVGVFCNKGYGRFWNQNSGNEPQLKIEVDLIIHALSQHKYEQGVEYPKWFMQKITE